MLCNRKTVVTIVATVLLLAVSLSIAVAVEVAPGVSLKGYMQNRIYLAPGTNAQYRLERLSISAIGALPNDSTAYTEVYYHPYTTAGNANVYLESAYYDTGLGMGRIRIGKGRRMTFGIVPSWPNRKTSNYGLVAEAMTQDRIQGVQYMLQRGTLDAGVSIHNGYRLGIRNLGDVPGDTTRTVSGASPGASLTPASPNTIHAIPHLSFREGDSTLRPSNKPAISARLGGKWKGGFSAGVSQMIGSLDAADLASIRPGGALGGAAGLVPATETSNTMNVTGLDASFKTPSGFILQGEWYGADVSTLDYAVWDVTAGFEAANGWKYYARYGKQNMDITPTANPLTWDTKQVSLSVVQPLRKGMWLQYEAEINGEEPVAGIGKFKNNLFFVELFTAF